ncbi:hypothetical protein DPMN_162441 [Dreissena polymorpha]|uniref:Uncharacterized protein n=1 Tax=Dreissena polymorpha TaxID=45954 RepID=A0A9D4ERI8_DREPO|nr:hypothetical protein DPMN_162441 [Dreissena polymorpha]
MEDEVDEALDICPLWVTQTWYPLFLECLISITVRLPRHKDLLTLVYNQEKHPMRKKMQLVGAIVSGSVSKRMEFRKWLLTRSYRAGNQDLLNNIQVHGQNGLCGVVCEIAIPLDRLK